MIYLNKVCFVILFLHISSKPLLPLSLLLAFPSQTLLGNSHFCHFMSYVIIIKGKIQDVRVHMYF